MSDDPGSVEPNGIDWTIRREAHFGDRVVRCFANRPRNLYAMLKAAVDRAPNGESLVCGSRRLNWRQTHEQVLRVAGALQALGIGRGDRIALVLGNEIEFPLVTLAAAALGAVIVPIGIREQGPGIAFLVQNSGAKAILYDAVLAERVPIADVPELLHRIEVATAGAASDARPASSASGAPRSQASSTAFPTDGATFATSAMSPIRFDTLLEGPLLDPAANDGPASDAFDEESVAAILYTSGTTGRPKGAMLTHFNIVHSAMNYERGLDLREGERCCVTVPLSHVTGLVALLMVAVRTAGTLIVVPHFKAADFLALAARERVGFTLMVPAMYALCLMQDDLDRHDLSAWRVGGFGGAPMAPATIDGLAVRLPGLGLSNCYGSTETTSPATIMPPSLTRDHLASVGLPVVTGDVLVMDEHGVELPTGEPGELWLRGPMVVKGYWNNPQASAANIVAGFWRSGDLGRVDADGFTYVLDRQKDMLNRGGFKVYSVEVENVLSQHPDVIEAAVIGRPCPVLGERVHAFVTGRPGAVLDVQALRALCSEHLADYKVPETLTTSDEPLPRNANGKLMKRELRDRLLASLAARDGSAAA
ncbi:MAG: O-succinylbenzoic acid--CoA ligase [Rhizobacter sp.]|nr:O-succinylbenzoic acid--CoA ligase [Rhizobacter sp.]